MSKLDKFFIQKENQPEYDPLIKQRSEAFMFNISTAVEHNRPIDMHVVREELVDLIKLHAGGLVQHSECDSTLNFAPKDMQRTLKNVPYLAMSDTLVYIPRGMKGSLIETGIGLLKIAKLLQEVEKQVIDPLVKYTADLIESPEELQRPFPLKVTIRESDVTDTLDALYQLPSEKVQARYADVVSRNADWIDAGVLNTEIQEILSPERLASLIKKHTRVRELSKLLDSVLERANADLTGSAKTISSFVEYTQYAAKLLTLYGLANSHAIAYNVCLNDNLTRLKEIIK